MSTRKHIIALSLVLVLFSFTACGDSQPVAEGATASITIEGLDGALVASGDCALSDGTTAYDAFLLLCEDKSIEFKAEGLGSSAYITSVGGLSAGDEGTMSGWLFKVNGQMADVGAGSYALSDGDEVLFYFAKDFMAEFE